MTIWLWVLLAIFVPLFLAFVAWFAFEVKTAPLVDENERVISDPYHRMPH